jgi:hypothetical protein
MIKFGRFFLLPLLVPLLATVSLSDESKQMPKPDAQAHGWAGAEPGAEYKYQPFNTWQKIQFGATSLVNPTFVDAASVVYAVDPRNALQTAGPEEIRRLLASGDLAFALGTLEGSRSLSVSDANTKSFTDLIDKLKNAEDSNVASEVAAAFPKGVFLVKAETGKLKGVPYTGEWISWPMPEISRP